LLERRRGRLYSKREVGLVPRQQRAIVIDPDEHWRQHVKAMLTKADFLVIGEAEDGITALKLIRSRQPDLVVTEAFLPGMSGLELARIVHDDKLAPVVITCTTYDQTTLGKAVEAQAQGFLVKPLDEATVIPAVEIALANYKERMRLEAEVRLLKDSLETRKVIERAKGILMQTMGLSESEAFRRMQKQSMNKRISMRAVAEAIILAHNIGF